MKKLLIIALCFVAFAACKNEQKKEDKETEIVPIPESEKSIKGNFIHYEDVAVLMGKNFIYGVELNDMAKELAERVAPYKAEEYDMVQVILRGEVNPKPEGQDGWDEILTIEEIIFVDDKPVKDDVRIQ